MLHPWQVARMRRAPDQRATAIPGAVWLCTTVRSSHRSGNGAQPDGGRVEKDRVAMEEVAGCRHAHSRCAQFLEHRGIRSPPALGIVSDDDQHVVTAMRRLVHGEVDDRPAGAEAQVRDQMDDAHGQLRLVITRRERG